VTFIGGATICAQDGYEIGDPTDIVISMLGQLNAALAPLQPFFTILDFVKAVFDCIKAIPDCLGPPPSPSPIVSCISGLTDVVNKLLQLIPPFPILAMVKGILLVIITGLEGLKQRLEAIQEHTIRVLNAATKASQTGNLGLQGLVDCAQGQPRRADREPQRAAPSAQPPLRRDQHPLGARRAAVHPGDRRGRRSRRAPGDHRLPDVHLQRDPGRAAAHRDPARAVSLMANPINPTTLVGLRCWLTLRARRRARLGQGFGLARSELKRQRRASGDGCLRDRRSLPTRATGAPRSSFDGTNDYLGPIVDVIESVGKTFTLIVTHKMTPGATFGASVSIGGGLGEGGGGSYNVSMQADTSGGFSTAQLSTDGGGNTDSLLRQFGTADFETLAVRQDYFWVPQNLFLWSEDFGNAAWQKVAGAVVLTDVADGPLGGHTADVLVTTGASYLQQNSIMPSMSAGRSYDASVWVKADRRLPALLLDTDAKGASVPFHADLKIGSGSFVVAVWYKNTANTAGTHVILQYANAYNTGFLLNNVGGDFGGYVGSGAPQINLGAPFATLNKWYRVVLVGDANAQTLKCYINGVLMQTASGVTWSVTPNEPLYIGRSPDLPVTARGLYRDVVICKDSVPGFVVPLLADVQADFNRTADFTGISARYPLNEASGANVFASVGGAGTGSTVGSPTRTTTQAGLVFTIGDGNDGVPAVTARSGMPIESTDLGSRVDIRFTIATEARPTWRCSSTLAGVSGDEVQLFGRTAHALVRTRSTTRRRPRADRRNLTRTSAPTRMASNFRGGCRHDRLERHRRRTPRRTTTPGDASFSLASRALLGMARRS
jgi:hypothetical protein